MGDRNIRWGELTTPSKDKGPFKLSEIETDGKKMDVQMIDGFGMQSNPHTGSQVLILVPDGDEGKAVGIPMPRPKDRVDQLKEGETQHKNHDTGNAVFHDADGNSKHNAKKDIIMSSGGILHLNPG